MPESGIRNPRPPFRSFLWAVALLEIAAAGSVWSDSLWAGARTSRTLFGDRKARDVGDVVTVLIVESATATQTANTATEKKTDVSVEQGTGFMRFLPDGGWGASGTSKATGSTTRTGLLTASLTATVKEVLPNGNLKIEGKREILVNKEKQILVLSGIIRQDDIAPDNTVSSTSIAEANIRYDGKGPIAAKQKEGLITRLLHMFW